MDNLEAFRQQYGSLHDACARALSYQFAQDGGWPCLKLEVEAYHLTNSLPHSKRTLTLSFDKVKTFVLDEQGFENLHGISYLFSEGHYHFDFTTELSSSIEQMENDSAFYIMSERFSFEVIPSIN